MSERYAPAARNLITIVGAALALFSFILIVFLLLIQFLGVRITPYIGILTFLALPILLVIGLLLIPLGIFWTRMQRRRRGIVSVAEALPLFPVLDLNVPRQQQTFALFAVATVFILALLGTVSYQSTEFMDSVTFCGQTCHTVMKPEYTAYLRSPHARVPCTSCHIGPGASWFVKSKLSGTYQIIATLFNTYPHPIPVPIKDLRPARETCEKCHWPEKFYSDKMMVFNRYASDEKNTEQKIFLLVKTGGGNERTGVSMGIHWHMNIRNEIRYIATDPERQNIPWVQVKSPNGEITEYMSTASPLTPQQIQAAEKRDMDCMDCHNRPTHIFYPPGRAVDDALGAKRIDVSLPYIKKKAVEALTTPYSTTEQAMEGIARAIDSYYKTSYPDIYAAKGKAIQTAITSLQQIYRENVFPSMKVTWDTYWDNIGHVDSPGCFRCHDGKHRSADGRIIRLECNICHSIPMAASSSSTALLTPQTLPPEPPSHKSPEWILKHGKEERTTCGACHAPSFCANTICHGRNWLEEASGHPQKQ
ncbi:MAG: cytochrome C [Chloroflexi bacterium]|nr:cytochrome C [Chloroflexota bacterium]MCL5075047.1 cytochrome C [Chloroflexota bacterium]